MKRCLQIQCVSVPVVSLLACLVSPVALAQYALATSPGGPESTSSAALNQVRRTGARRPSREQVKYAIDKAEDFTDDLDDDFDDAMDKTPLDGTDEEERLDRQMEALEDTMDEIQDQFDDAPAREVRDLVDRALSIANDIDRVIVKYRFTDDVERDWSRLRTHLNIMARYYGLQTLR